MKAEALLRTGNATGALDIVNQIRTKEVLLLAALTTDNLLAEGRELYWEGHRRTDLIRFGKFLNAWEESCFRQRDFCSQFQHNLSLQIQI